MTGPGPSARPAPLPARLHDLRRTLVMGVVNVTPDSFSDGGRWFTPGAAVAHGLELLDQGADLLDVGGESTRPGARRVPVDDELARVLPVIEAAGRARRDGERRHHARGRRPAAVERGAVIVNDVSGGLADDAMDDVVAQTGAVYVAMHWRGHADVMDDLDDYDDVVADVRRELGRAGRGAARGGRARRAGGARPGPRLRQVGRQQLAAAGAAARAGGRRLPGAGRREPQAVPRPPAGGPGRRARRRRSRGTARPRR